MFKLMEPPTESSGPRALNSGGSGLTSDNDFNSIFSVLSRRRLAMLAIFTTFLMAVGFFTLTAPKKYVATVTFIAGNGGSTLSQGSNASAGVSSIPILNALLAINGGQSPETYIALLQERPLAAAVIQDVGLDSSPRALLSHINVQPVTNTAMLALKAWWTDPQTAARIANSFATVFVERERDLISGQSRSALEFITKQLPAAQANLRRASADLAAYQVAHSLADINVQTQTTLNTVSGIESRIAQNQVDAGQAQAQLASVSGQLGSMASTIQGSLLLAKNPVLAQLQDQLSQTTIQLQALSHRYTENHPQVIAMRGRQAELERQIAQQQTTVTLNNNIVPNPLYQQLNQQAATLRAQIAGDKAQVSLLNNQLASSSQSLKRLPVEALKLADLKRQATLAENIYNALQQKQSEAIISKTTSLSDVAVTETASPDDVAVKPDVRFNLLVGSIVGLFLALSGAFVLELFDRSIKDEKAALQELGLPILTTVPKITAKRRAALPWLRAVTIESFIMLVSALRYSSDRQLRSFALTSPMQGDGKSTIALNTAVAMAEVRPKVLLVDGDMRRPTLHEKLQLKNTLGFSDVLVNNASLSSVIQQTRYSGLDFLPSGFGPPNAFRLLESPRFLSALAEMLESYDAVIFDTPAIAGMLDALTIASKVDGTLLVVSAGVTDTRATKRALYRLENTTGVSLLGMILNQTELRRNEGAYNNYYIDAMAPLPLAEDTQAV
ncbi:MAG: GumC family protein [Candidatus Eremiobacter antarcticus]